jgi:hypothetical protein
MLRGACHDLGLAIGRVASQRLQYKKKLFRKHSVNLADLCIPVFNESKWRATQSLASDGGKWIRAGRARLLTLFLALQSATDAAERAKRARAVYCSAVPLTSFILLGRNASVPSRGLS